MINLSLKFKHNLNTELSQNQEAVIEDKRNLSKVKSSDNDLFKRTIMICYANHRFYWSQRKLLASARKFADFDEYYAFAPWDVDRDFRIKNKKILSCARGGGYWLWKPYFIKKMLDNMRAGEILFYADSGSCFIDSCAPLINLCKQKSTPIISFESSSHSESILTKRDCFVAIGCDKPEYFNSLQIMGGFPLWRKCALADKFIAEWLYYAQDYQLISNSPSRKLNYPGFQEHRHDQSIFSLLCKKYKITPFRSPSQWGNRVIDNPRYKNSAYPQILNLTKGV